jgi:Calcineurin-like phosphoesterase
MLLLLNDLHLGAKRKGGATPASAEALRTHMFAKAKELVFGHTGDLLVLGDLFDSFDVDARDWVDTFSLFRDWLSRSPSNRLTLVAGNHDISPRAGKVSGFEMLWRVLQCEQLDLVDIGQLKRVHPNAWALAHCHNQDTFNLMLDRALSEVPAGASLLLHANLDNNFASESDYSLNVSSEVAKAFCEKGVSLAFAHEHQARTYIPHGMSADAAGVVNVLGNQVCSSVSDCLGNDDKWAWAIDDNGAVVKHIKTWDLMDAVAPFSRVDWRELDKAPDAGFVRVEGVATMAEAAEVVQAISKLRNKSGAFVIANAVKVEGMPELDDLPDTFEAAKRFDVLAFIRSRLEPEEQALLEKLL